MNLPDAKQLVRKSSGHIEEQHTRKMVTHTKLAWIVLFFCLELIALTHCVPVEVIYTGEGCECPSKLGYSVDVPNMPQPKKYIQNEYGYRVEVPTPRHGKAKVTYSFDFTVEEPRTQKPVKPTKLNLFAKVDRVAVKRGDCEDSYAAASAPSGCRCGQCGISKPFYRYVFNSMTPSSPCKCGRPNCECNRCRAASTQYSPNAIFMGPPLSDVTPEPMDLETGVGDGEDINFNSDDGGAGSGAITGNTRRKRDLQRTLFRPRKLASERSNRFLKLYHKNLSNKPRRSFDFNGHATRQYQEQQQAPKKAKRKAKKTRYTHKRARLVKRDIKGEYEQLEKEREEMDLTLPEIIQYMPETLQPNFKRGQCYFGCGCDSQRLSQTTSAESKIDTLRRSSSSSSSCSSEYSINSKTINANNTTVYMANTDTNSGTNEMNMDMTTGTGSGMDNVHFIQSEKTGISAQSEIGSAYTKRNAGNYYSGRSLSSAESACPSCSMRLPALQQKNAYPTHSPTAPPISTNPNYESQQPTYSKIAQSAAQPTAQAVAEVPALRYFYDQMGRKYLESNGYLRAVTSTMAVPDALDPHGIPLRYAGDLESPSLPFSSYPKETSPSVAARHYPVQHISNEQLDQMIIDIVHRHPAFIDATTHLDGALVDPEPLQEYKTKSFIKKLKDGRLGLRFGPEDVNNPLPFDPSYSASAHRYGIPPLGDLLPPLY